MRYMMLIYSQESDATEIEESAVVAGHRAVMEGSTKIGIFRAAEALESTATATTVRVEDGKVLITDGPFAETKELLAGYYILDCTDLDEAIEWAAKIPSGCFGLTGCVEIRPIREVSKYRAVNG